MPMFAKSESDNIHIDHTMTYTSEHGNIVTCKSDND